MAMGQGALSNSTTASFNIANGNAALLSNIGGSENIAIGAYSMLNSASGIHNVAVGHQAMYFNTAGNYNVATGHKALESNSTGAFNVANGYDAGRLIGSGAIASSVNDSVFLGANTRPLNNAETNQIVIGYGTVGAGSNTVTLGNASIGTTQLRGNVITNGAITCSQFKLSALNTAPANASATGVTGEIRYDANYMYVCVATNTWKRSAIATWP
jgi:hypothetical protein